MSLLYLKNPLLNKNEDNPFFINQSSGPAKLNCHTHSVVSFKKHSLTELFSLWIKMNLILLNVIPLVSAQLPGANGYTGGKVIFIDTEVLLTKQIH